MSARRNEPCPCGSGLKHKHCCEGKQTGFTMSRWSAAIAVIVLLSGLIIAAMSFTRSDSDAAGPPPGPAPAGKVWSPEHGHYH